MSRIIDELKRTDHKRYLGGLDFFKYIGPGLLVTVGFIDPGNWASNFAKIRLSVLFDYKIRMHGSNPYRASSKLYLLKLSTLKIFLFLCQIHCIVRTFT